MIDDFFTTTFTVRRPQWLEDEEGNPYSDLADVGTFRGQLQQADIKLVEGLALSYSTAFSVWCPLDADVHSGDTIIAGSSTYSVKFMQRYDIGENAHKELVVQQNGVPQGT